MTEENAKTRWCPLTANNPTLIAEGQGNCIASDCMAWRWLPDRTVWDARDEATRIRTGFCGLAGKP